MRYIYNYISDVGIQRRNNQDSLLIREMIINGKLISIFLVCDGMGGFEQGENASATTVYAFSQWMEIQLARLSISEMTNIEILHRLIREYLEELNEKIKHYGIDNNVKLGTTVSLLLLMEDKYLIVNLGDSRVYKIRDNLEQITHDQSWVQREIDNNRMTREEANRSPKRNILLQCLGAPQKIYPLFYDGNLETDTWFVLCSDGFVHNITEKEILDSLKEIKDITEDNIKVIVHSLVKKNMERKETDNITAIAVYVK